MMFLRLCVSFSLFLSGAAFVSVTRQTRAPTDVAAELVGRRQWMEAAVVSTGASLSLPRFALADISDGNTLPRGAAEFSRLLKIKGDIITIQKRVAEAKSGDIDNEEWENIRGFLRRVYGASDDMKVVGGGIYDPSKKSSATEFINQIKKYSVAGDQITQKQDPEATIAVLAKCNALIGDFLDLLKDVPDEI